MKMRRAEHSKQVAAGLSCAALAAERASSSGRQLGPNRFHYYYSHPYLCAGASSFLSLQRALHWKRRVSPVRFSSALRRADRRWVHSSSKLNGRPHDNRSTRVPSKGNYWGDPSTVERVRIDQPSVNTVDGAADGLVTGTLVN